ncbi:hypothetical protein [Dyella silvatica]|uniref:hypothetical protein n=1 Tax=Dyella silvatica TaxID=2992128 RepID=UPI00225BCA36|nr:hypothetical protein [Dyella silvatica]
MTATVLALIAIQTLLTYSPGLSAFEVPKLSLEEKVAKSTFVFIGTVKEADYQDLRRTRSESVAQVRIDTLLKGTATGDVEVIYSNGIAESAPDCCVLGGKYLFFVAANSQGLLQSVNGPYGIYLIDPPLSQASSRN